AEITAGALCLSLLGAFYFYRPFNTISDAPSAGKTEAISKAEVQEAYGKLPLSFEANRGQTDGQVKFFSRGHDYVLYLTATETVLKLRDQQPDRDGAGANSKSAIIHNQETQSAVLRMKLQGANPRPEIAGLDQLPG